MATFTSLAHKTRSTLNLAFTTKDTLAPCAIRCKTRPGHTSWHDMLDVEMDLSLERNDLASWLLFREADWEEVSKQLQTRLAHLRGRAPPSTREALDGIVDDIMNHMIEV